MAALSFVSPKELVQEWMTYIDVWINSTNTTGPMETDEADRRAQDEEVKGQARQDRLRVVSDSVRHL